MMVLMVVLVVVFVPVIVLDAVPRTGPCSAGRLERMDGWPGGALVVASRRRTCPALEELRMEACSR